MNERLKGGIFSDEWKVRKFKSQFEQGIAAEQPYEHQEYPKAIQLGEVTHTAHNAEEEAALSGIAAEQQYEHQECPKAIQLGEVTHTAHNAEEEAALSALVPEAKSE